MSDGDALIMAHRQVEEQQRAHQRRRMKLPKGDLRLEDGRVLRPILGYDIRKIRINDATHDGILASAGWKHEPTRFVVTASIDDSGHSGPLLHVAISYPDHDPTWDEIKAVRAAFFTPDMDAMMVLPRASLYVNAHPHCFHLWQMPEPWDIG